MAEIRVRLPAVGGESASAQYASGVSTSLGAHAEFVLTFYQDLWAFAKEHEVTVRDNEVVDDRPVPDQPPYIERRVVARIVMPSAAAESLRQLLERHTATLSAPESIKAAPSE